MFLSFSFFQTAGYMDPVQRAAAASKLITFSMLKRALAADVGALLDRGPPEMTSGRPPIATATSSSQPSHNEESMPDLSSAAASVQWGPSWSYGAAACAIIDADGAPPRVNPITTDQPTLPKQEEVGSFSLPHQSGGLNSSPRRSGIRPQKQRRQIGPGIQ